MVINKKKSKVMLFNPKNRSLDFLPKVTHRGETLDVCEKMRLVGLIINDDLTWMDNTSSLVKRAYGKLWLLRRSKILGADTKILRLIYFRHIRSILEFGVPVWNGAISLKESQKLERVQKIAVHIIYGKNRSYRENLEKFRLEKLSVRRQRLCLNFAKKSLKHSKFSDWFVKEHNDTTGKTKFAETVSRFKRLQNSPIPYLTRLLNSNNV